MRIDNTYNKYTSSFNDEINLFGNITVTNQFNYTTMKNAVQAAMYDSLDLAYYRAGFCVCTTDGSALNGVKTFSDKRYTEVKK